jgi:HSP20 family molecular chaperone IbpA
MNTTDVFVVTDGLNTYYTNTISGTVNTGLTLTGTGSSSSLINYSNPTYNDFWKFDEELDLLWKSFFEKGAQYRPITEKAVQHPVDIQEDLCCLKIEIAAVGLDKSDIDIIVDSETLRVAHRKSDEEKELEANEYRYFHRSIKKAGFDIAWKVSSKYELAKLTAGLDKGLLTLEIPFAKENKPKKIEIK